jgi:hypothetical protein
MSGMSYKIADNRCIIMGNTYPNRQLLLVCQGRWLPDEKVWLMPVSFKEAHCLQNFPGITKKQ